ncbi:hypothetical protein HYPSUDRAFT_113970, partial [Hypholoma sublateritium FD-334 SS-4]
YEVIRPLHNSATVSGRATLVWLVRRRGVYYVLKDSWPLQTKPFSEIQHLITINRAIRSDPEISKLLRHKYPIFVIGEELGDSTELRRKDILGGSVDFPRVHRRVVTKPVGDPLTSFRSKYELCSVLCDVVEYLKYINEECHICHGDISLKNIVIKRGSTSNANIVSQPIIPNESGSTAHTQRTEPSITAHGVAIDYDNSFSIVEIAESRYKINSGTLPFMAVEALNWKDHEKFDHLPQHDLESLFYVLVTVCTYVDAPGYLRNPVPLKTDLSIPANEWWATFDRHTLARVKSSQVGDLDDQILSRLSPYWKDFHPVIRDLQKA